jgi:Ser/Thr protein kinase RdoA (MazF antagonist)
MSTEAGWVPFVPRWSRVRASTSARFGGPEIDPPVVAEILRRYGLRGIASSRNLRLARRSRNVWIESDRGRKALKLYRPRWREQTVEEVHSVLERLEALDVPAPRPNRTLDGATWSVIDGSIAAVFDWIEGRNYSINYLRRRDRLRLTTMAGETLSGLHLALADFDPTGAHHLGFVSRTGPRRRDAAWHRTSVDDLRARSANLDDPLAQPLADQLIVAADPVVDEIARLEDVLDGADFPRFVIHGDFGLHNLLIRPTGPAVPVDFELTRLDWRVNDLISVLGKHRYQGRAYDFESMETLLGAYVARCPMTDDERHLFPEAWRLYKLQAAVQYWISYFETEGPVRKLASALDSIEQAAWVRDDPTAIASLVGSPRLERPESRSEP